MIAEAMMTFGWNLEQSLQMPVRAFFALSKAARELTEERNAAFYIEMCDIVVCATGQTEYHRDIRALYQKRLMKDKPLPLPPSVDLTNKEQTMKALGALLGGR